MPAKMFSMRVPEDVLQGFDQWCHTVHLTRTEAIVKYMRSAIKGNVVIAQKEPVDSPPAARETQTTRDEHEEIRQRLHTVTETQLAEMAPEGADPNSWSEGTRMEMKLKVLKAAQEAANKTGAAVRFGNEPHLIED